MPFGQGLAIGHKNFGSRLTFLPPPRSGETFKERQVHLVNRTTGKVLGADDE
jgi:hypothetical protein